MKILINALTAKQGGGQTYLANLIKHFPSTNDTYFYILCAKFNESLFQSNNNISLIVLGTLFKNTLFRTLYETFVLPFFVLYNRFDLYYQPAAGLPSLIFKPCKVMTTLQNMLILDENERKRFPFFSLVRFKMFLLSVFVFESLKRSDKIIFISKYSQDYIKKRLPDIEKRSCVIPHGLDFSFIVPQHDLDIHKYGLKENEFYLYVSILDYYKAQKELVEEWDILSQANFKYPLVLTGFLSRKKYVKIVYDEIRKRNLCNKILITGPIEHQKLPSLYRKSRALVFASSCECCPNILLEKMSSGIPLFSSQFPPMPEFGQDIPVYFNPYQRGDLARKILDFESNPQPLRDRSSRAIQLLEQYTWNKTASDTLNFMKD